MKKPRIVKFTVLAKYYVQASLTDEEVEALDDGASSADDLMQLLADRHEREAEVEYNFMGSRTVEVRDE